MACAALYRRGSSICQASKPFDVAAERTHTGLTGRLEEESVASRARFEDEGRRRIAARRLPHLFAEIRFAACHERA